MKAIKLTKPGAIIMILLAAGYLLLFTPVAYGLSPELSTRIVIVNKANSYCPGDTVTMELWLAADQVCSFGSFQADISYDSTKLTITDINHLAQGFSGNSNFASDSARLVYAPSDSSLNLSSTAVKVAEIAFTVNQEVEMCETELSVENALFFCVGNGEELPALKHSQSVILAPDQFSFELSREEQLLRIGISGLGDTKGQLILVGYDASCRMVGIWFAPDLIDNAALIRTGTMAGAVRYKAMLINNTDYQPLCAAAVM